MNARAAASIKSERFFLNCLARLSIALSNSSDRVIDVLTFILLKYYDLMTASMDIYATLNSGFPGTEYLISFSCPSAKRLALARHHDKVGVMTHQTPSQKLRRVLRPCARPAARRDAGHRERPLGRSLSWREGLHLSHASCQL